ncbi:MAG TPA: hypothetical protein DCZ10_19875 [Pelotomaculum sp.]|nr:hypothetical protein [Pelotomaculum sp.]
MKITGFFVRPKTVSFSRLKNVRSLLRFCGVAFIALGTSAAPAVANPFTAIAQSTFGPGGPGMVITQLMLIAVVGCLCGYIAQAAGKGQVAGMIHVATVFSCIAIIAGVAMDAINAVGKLLG